MKKFNEIYEEVIKNNKDELEKLRKEYLFKIIITITLAICIYLLCYKFTNQAITIIVLMFLIFFVCIFFMKKPKYKYQNVYKQKVVKKFIKEYDENLSYKPEGVIPSHIYRNAGFETSYDRYHSEDLIVGKIDDHEIIMGEVHTEREEESTDSDGNTTTTYVTIFHGMFGNIKINNIYNGEMKIHSDKGKLGKLFGNKNRVEMDSTEFEKYFDVYAEDKIQVMQVLTSDIMEQMIAFRKSHKTKFEITINRDQLYIRFHTGNMFEANILKSSVNFDTLKKVYDIINFTFDITRSFIKISEETEI